MVIILKRTANAGPGGKDDLFCQKRPQWQLSSDASLLMAGVKGILAAGV
jgi:hypothetical protein